MPGILAALVYVAADEPCAARYPGYDQLDQTISELSAIVLTVFILSGPLWAIVPMHQRGATTTWQDTGHLVMGGVSLVLMLAGARALWQRFRAFSVVMGLAVLAAGLATFATALVRRRA